MAHPSLEIVESFRHNSIPTMGKAMHLHDTQIKQIQKDSPKFLAITIKQFLL